MKRVWNVVAFLVLIALVVLWVWPSRAPAPDERIAAHWKALCAIADKGVAKPRRGVEKMFRYYGEHGPDLARDFAELLVLIERIDDDRSHDDRARKAARRIQEPLRRCEETLDRFGRAIEADPEASRLLERGLERLSRTIEILLGAQARWALHALPLPPRR
jgi:hypothetical protein